MREIRFRGKHKFKDIWVYGNLFYGLCGAWIRQNYMEPFDTLQFYGGWTEVKPETVGQYIGLKDKKNKDIYEGDIILIDGQRYAVYWDEAMASFGLRNKHGETFPIPLPPLDAEIIGNIYDNPELFEDNGKNLDRCQKHKKIRSSNNPEDAPINFCSELECPANKHGECTISTCILVDPEKAIKEIMNKKGGALKSSK